MAARAALDVKPVFVNEIKFCHQTNVVTKLTNTVYCIAPSIGKHFVDRH